MVTSSPTAARTLSRDRLWTRPVRLATAALGPFATAGLLATARGDSTAATAALVLVVWVVALSATGDRLAGLVAALSAAAWFDYFLAPPYYRFAIANQNDVEVTVLLVVIGAIVGELALWGSRQQVRAGRRAGYINGVISTAETVAEGNTPPAVLTSVVAKQIGEVLHLTTCRYVDGPLSDPRIGVLHHDGTLMRNGHEVDVARHGLPTDDDLAILVRRGDTTYGHFLLNSADRLSYPGPEQLRVAVLLADQTAIALANRP
jgi:K+-sensing histidine kinase KdpD